jgi:hypothetical protein
METEDSLSHPLNFILSQMNPVHILIHQFEYHPHLGLGSMLVLRYERVTLVTLKLHCHVVQHVSTAANHKSLFLRTNPKTTIRRFLDIFALKKQNQKLNLYILKTKSKPIPPQSSLFPLAFLTKFCPIKNDSAWIMPWNEVCNKM